ncbi:hypothetical protein F4804DRAFT_351440 [Jackrogersella minutella]|nr:hypothetical protein F4804DRAFT_351440 [Jackrogersella minutella]
MSCQWRHKSHDNWELTQSNPPSELPNDPIVSTSSNPDERSSSPTAQSEHQINDSLFSNAAQAETEPIPRDGIIPRLEDMLIHSQDFPAHSSLASDIDDHIASLNPSQEIMEHHRPEPRGVRRKKDAGAAKSDGDDSEFELPESGSQDSDDSYVEETHRRGKRKVASNPVRGKATARNTSVAKGSKKAATKKAQPQKSAKTTSTASKGPKKGINAAGAHNSTTKASVGSLVVAARISRHAQNGNEEKTFERPENVIPNSQPPAKKQERQKETTTRFPKKSFYNEPEHGQATKAVKDANNKAKPRLNAGPMAGNKQTSSKQNDEPPFSPIRISDDDEEDVWYNSVSPEKQERNLSKAQAKNHISPPISDAGVTSNVKKKRSPAQSEPKTGTTKKSTLRTYGQKPAQKLDKSEYFLESKEQEAQHERQSRPAESNQPTGHDTDHSDQSENLLLNEADTWTHPGEGNNESIKQKPVQPKIMEQPAPEARPSDRYPRSTIDLAPVPSQKHELPKALDADAQAIPRKQLHISTPINNTNGHPKQTAPLLEVHEGSGGREESRRSDSRHLNVTDSSRDTYDAPDNRLASSIQKASDQTQGSRKEERKTKASPTKKAHIPHPAPDMNSNQRQLHTGDEEKGKSNTDTPISQPQKFPVSAEAYEPFLMEANNNQQLDGTPRHITMRSRFKLTERPQAQLDHDEPRSLHTTSDFEPRLFQADIPPLNRRVQAQAPDIVRLETLDNLESYRTKSNRMSRIALSPSSSAKHSAKHTKEIASEAPQIHPKSIDFACRVAQRQRESAYDQEVTEETHGRDKYQPPKRLSWLQPRATNQPRDDPTSLPFKTNKLGDFFNGQPSRVHESRPVKPAPKPEYEMKWQDAVEAASGGVVDILHSISTNILEHLRTREENILAVVHEYKRNGTKISERLTKRQTGELVKASTAINQKYLELANLYGDLSKETQDFRAKCLSEHRNQAYAEWQRQTARVKDAIRTAREEAMLGRK